MAQINIPDFETIGKEILADAVTHASVTGLNFFKESFEKQGWTDEGFTAWDKTKNGDGSRAILTHTGNLRDATQILSRSPQRIEFGNTAPYAEIHNNGGIIAVAVTARSRKFFWYMYCATKKQMWKGMALTKKSHLNVKIPKRQFIGESQTLMGNLDDWAINQIVEKFNNIKF